MLKSMLVNKIFNPGIWLAGTTSASQSEDMLENPCWLTWNLTWILLSNPGPRCHDDAVDTTRNVRTSSANHHKKTNDDKYPLAIIAAAVPQQNVSRPPICKMRVLKYYVKSKALFETWNKVNENKVWSYCEKLRWCKSKSKTNERLVLHYVKLTNPISFQTRFAKRGPKYKRQVVNPRHQIPQGQPVAKPGTPQ